MQEERDKMEVRYISTFQLAVVIGLLILRCVHSPPLSQGITCSSPTEYWWRWKHKTLVFISSAFATCITEWHPRHQMLYIIWWYIWLYIIPEHTQPGMFLQKQDPWHPTLILQSSEPKDFCCLSNLAQRSQEKLPKSSRPVLMLKTWRHWPWLIVSSVRGWQLIQSPGNKLIPGPSLQQLQPLQRHLPV